MLRRANYDGFVTLSNYSFVTIWQLIDKKMIFFDFTHTADIHSP